MNSGPDALKKSSSAPKPVAAPSNALTRMLTKSKGAEASDAAATLPSAAATAPSEEHVSTLSFLPFAFDLFRVLLPSQLAPEPMLVCEQASVGSVE